MTNSVHDVVTYNPGEMMVLKGWGAEPRIARRAAPRSPVRARSEVPCPPLHHFHHVGKELELQSPLPLRSFCASNCSSRALSGPSLRRLSCISAMLLVWVSTVEPSSPFCGCCSRGLSEQQTVRTKIFGRPKWLDMAGHGWTAGSSCA